MPRFANVVLLSISLLLLALAPAAARAQPASPAAEAGPIRVLFVGNSLTYANNMPRILAAIAASQPGGPAIETVTYALPGAELDDLWDDGNAAEALRNGDFDVVVLQELGGLPMCFLHARPDSGCRRSVAAHRNFIQLATERDARVLLFMTWNRARTATQWSSKADLIERKELMHDTYDKVLRAVTRSGDQVALLPAAEALFEFATTVPQDQVLSDRMHPTMAASTIIAAQLYAAVTGQPARAADLMIDFPLLPPESDVRDDVPMERQSQLAGDGSRFLVKADMLAPLFAIANRPPSR